MKLTTLLTCATLFAANCTFAADNTRIGMLARVTGNTAFELARFGAEEAASELGIELVYMAPRENTAESQLALLEKMIADGVEGIMLSANDESVLTPALKLAADAGIKIVTYDQDIEATARHLHIAPSTNELIAFGPAQIVRELVEGDGDIGVITGPKNSTTQNEWVDELVKLTKEDSQFKDLNIVEVAYGDERYDKAYSEALRMTKNHPELKAIVAYSSIGLLATAQMVRDQGLSGQIKVTGLGFPNEMLAHVLSGAVPAFAIWNMTDLGYTATHATMALIDGRVDGAKDGILKAGRMGYIVIGENQTAVMGELFVYDQHNIKTGARTVRAANILSN